jgi:hypothetical protein
VDRIVISDGKAVESSTHSPTRRQKTANEEGNNLLAADDKEWIYHIPLTNYAS